MSLIGKKLIIIGADWSDVAIGKLRVALSQNTLAPNSTATLSAWIVGTSATTCTATSSNTSYATVGARSGAGTQAEPYTWTITAVTDGSVTLTVTLDSGLTTEEVRTLGLTVTEAPVVTYSVTGTITNGSVSSWPSNISSGSTATITVVPSAGYALELSDISKSSGTCGVISVSENIITIPNITSDIVLSITCHSAPVTGWFVDATTNAASLTTPAQISPAGEGYGYAGTALSGVRGKTINSIRCKVNTAGTLTIKSISSDAKNVEDSATATLTTGSSDVQTFALSKSLSIPADGFVGIGYNGDTGKFYCSISEANSVYSFYTYLGVSGKAPSPVPPAEPTTKYNLGVDLGYQN